MDTIRKLSKKGTFGRMVQDARKRMNHGKPWSENMTQAMLAKALGVSRAMVNHIELNHQVPAFGTCIKIAKVLGMDELEVIKATHPDVYDYLKDFNA